MRKNKRSGDGVYIPCDKEKKGLSWILIAIIAPFCMPLAALLVLDKGYKIWKIKKMQDFREYATIIGDRVQVSLYELSAKRDKPMSLVLSDIQKMIARGYMGKNAYIDHSDNMLYLNARETEFADEQPMEHTIHVVVDAPTPPRQEEKPAEPPKAEPPKEDSFDDVLREIRRLNDEIADAAVSARIDRVGVLTADIFQWVRDNPQQKDEVRKFMDYYLPTTLKLLKSYALMERQSYQGENIVASRRKIEQILDKLIDAFEQQSDRLFRSDAMDVDTDIQVLETMMAKDGLTQNKGSDFRAMGGH